MKNLVALKTVLIFGMLWFVFNNNPLPKFIGIERTLLPIPIMKYCSCDSATYCLNDEDVIQLHIWYENAKFYIR